MKQLEPWQAEKVKEQLAPILQYLGRLRDRLKAVGYGEDDKLYQAAHKAHDAAFCLSVLMHSVSCGGIFFIEAHAKEPPPGKDEAVDLTRDEIVQGNLPAVLDQLLRGGDGIGFPLGESRGTRDMISRARLAGIEVKVISSAGA